MMICRKPTVSAPRPMKSAPISVRVSARASRQWTGLRCRITPSALTIASVARKPKSQSGILLRSRENNDRGGHRQIEQSEGDQTLPAELHQLVIAHPRQRPADQNLQTAEEHHFCPKRYDLDNRHEQVREVQGRAVRPRKMEAIGVEPRHLPSAEEK